MVIINPATGGILFIVNVILIFIVFLFSIVIIEVINVIVIAFVIAKLTFRSSFSRSLPLNVFTIIDTESFLRSNDKINLIHSDLLVLQFNIWTVPH